MDWSVHWILAALIGSLFLFGGVIELILWRKFADKFVVWGYPRYWPIVTFTLKIVGGLMIFIPQTRPFGLALCALICIAAIVTLIAKREREAYFKEIPINLLFIGVSLTSWLTR